MDVNEHDRLSNLTRTDITHDRLSNLTRTDITHARLSNLTRTDITVREHRLFYIYMYNLYAILLISETKTWFVKIAPCVGSLIFLLLKAIQSFVFLIILLTADLMKVILDTRCVRSKLAINVFITINAVIVLFCIIVLP